MTQSTIQQLSEGLEPDLLDVVSALQAISHDIEKPKLLEKIIGIIQQADAKNQALQREIETRQRAEMTKHQKQEESLRLMVEGTGIPIGDHFFRSLFRWGPSL